MKLSAPTLRRAALGAVAAVVYLAGAFAIDMHQASATLPLTEKQMLEHAVNDLYYGDVLAVTQDGVYSAAFSLRGTTASSNNVISLTARRATQAAALGHPAVLNASASHPSGALYFYLSSSQYCTSIAATAATTLAVGSNGGYIPVVSGKTGWLLLNSAGTASLSIMHAPSFTAYPCVILPSGRVTPGAVVSF